MTATQQPVDDLSHTRSKSVKSIRLLSASLLAGPATMDKPIRFTKHSHGEFEEAPNEPASTIPSISCGLFLS